MEVEKLEYETAGGVGEQVCIRFRPHDFERIQRAATRERALPSPWIRAVVMYRVDQMNIEDVRAPKKITPHKSATRRIKDVTAKRAASAR